MIEKWQEIIGKIQDNFEVEEHDQQFIDEDGGTEIDYIVFISPVGKMRLELVTKPIVLDKKTTYSRRIGSDTAVDYVYSLTEKASKLYAYKWDSAADDWQEIAADNFIK